jgi:hypothetical protein
VVRSRQGREHINGAQHFERPVKSPRWRVLRDESMQSEATLVDVAVGEKDGNKSIVGSRQSRPALLGVAITAVTVKRV